jgi:hypothetical protein
VDEEIIALIEVREEVRELVMKVAAD